MVKTVVAQPYLYSGRVYSGYTGALHCDRKPYAAHFSIAHFSSRIFIIPVDELLGFFYAFVEVARVDRFVFIHEHCLSRSNKIQLSQPYRVKLHGLCKLIYRGFYGKYSLGSAKAPVGTAWNLVSVNYVV